MSSQSFASLSNSDEDDVPLSKVSTSATSFHLHWEHTDSDDGSNICNDDAATGTLGKSPSQSPIRKKQRNTTSTPLDLSSRSIHFMPGACGGPEDSTVIRRRTSTPIISNASSTSNLQSITEVKTLHYFFLKT